MLRSSLFTSLLICSVLLTSRGINAAPRTIEKPEKGKEYLLDAKRGPWMIMVATFHTTGANGQTTEGKTPDQAADDLVFELRELGFPAYKYIYEPENEVFSTTDLKGREDRRKNLRRIRTVCVVGGNYSSIDARDAQDTLAWVKALYPKCLREGVEFQQTKIRPTPLAGAFLTPNPLRPAGDAVNLVADKLQLHLNSGENFSLFDNKGKYTLVVHRFYGKSETVAASQGESAISRFVNKLNEDADLVDAGFAARELVAALRGNYDPSNTFNNVDAYVWHDHYESLVTVGSFNSKDDPRIAAYMAKFGPQSIQQAIQQTGGPGQTQPAHYGLTGFGEKRDQTRLWTFEPAPYLIEVPRAR
jgi:hypothetical protein